MRGETGRGWGNRGGRRRRQAGLLAGPSRIGGDLPRCELYQAAEKLSWHAMNKTGLSGLSGPSSLSGSSGLFGLSGSFG